MNNSFFRNYRKLFLLLILLICTVVTWFFGCRNQNTSESKNVWVKEEEDDVTYYKFENEYVKGRFSHGILNKTGTNNSTPVYLELQSMENPFAGTLIVTLPGEDGNGIAYQYAISADQNGMEDYTFQIPFLGSSSYFQVEILTQYSEVCLSELIVPSINDQAKVYQEDGNEYDKIHLGVLCNEKEGFNHLKNVEIYREDETYVSSVRYYDANNFPVDSSRLQGLNALFVDGIDTSTLEDKQIQCLLDWVVKDGGHLLIGTGENGEEVLAGFGKRIGVSSANPELNTVVFSTKGSLSGESLALTMADVIYDNKDNWKPSGWTTPEISEYRNFGKGSIRVFHCSFLDHSLLQWTYRSDIVELLFDNSELNLGPVEDEYSLWYIKNALFSFMNSQTPSTFFYGIFFVIYLFCIVFFGYHVLRRSKKQEYIWLTVPLLSFCFFVFIFFHSKMRNVTTNDAFSAVKVIDHINAERRAYFLYQNAEGESRSISLSRAIKKVAPFDYGYVTDYVEHAPIKDINQDFTINDTVNGFEIDFSEAVSGRTRLMRFDLEATNTIDAKAEYFTSSLDLDKGMCSGQITNRSIYDYDALVLIQGIHYKIFRDVTSGKTIKVNASDYSSWTNYQEENETFADEDTDFALANMFEYVKGEYLLNNQDNSNLYIIGITENDTFSLFADQSLHNQITVVAEKKKP